METLSPWKQVLRWSRFGVLTGFAMWGMVLLFSTGWLRLGAVGWYIASFLFPAWPLLQVSAGPGLLLAVMPLLCLLSNALLYGFLAFIWFGPGSSRIWMRRSLLFGLLFWFAYSVVWALVQRQLSLAR